MPDIYPVHCPGPSGILAWDGSAYRVPLCDTRGNLRLAPGGVNLRQYQSVYVAVGQNTGSSGDVVVNLPAVAAGALVVVTQLMCYMLSGACPRMSMALNVGGSFYGLAMEANPVVFRALTVGSHIVIPAGGYLRATAHSVTSSTNLLLSAVGYYVIAP